MGMTKFTRSFPAGAPLSAAALGLLMAIQAPAAPPSPSTQSTTRPTTEPAAAGKKIFNGKDLEGWKAADYGGHGDPAVEDGKLLLPVGEGLTGVTWAGKPEELSKTNYEITLEAERVDGSDFFCGLTFPIKESFASLIVGGWGGGVVGISSLDGSDASENETTSYHAFKSGRWYKVRLRVVGDKIQVWVDNEQVVDVDTKGRKVDIRADISLSKPLGFASWRTTAALRDIRMRELGADEK